MEEGARFSPGSEGAEAGENVQHPETLENPTPELFKQAYISGVVFIQSYGWFLIAGIVILYFVIKKAEPHIASYRQRQEYHAERNQDPDVIQRQQAGLDAARRRMQEVHEAKAAKFAEEQKVKEEKKRAEKIEDWQRHQEGRGYRSRVKAPEEGTSTGQSSGSASKPKKNVYRSNDYNPLTGESANFCYRPSRRGGASGGG